MISEKIFEYLFENLPFMLPWQPIKFSDLNKIHMNRRGLLKKHFCKKSKYLQLGSKNGNFHFSHYKSMETISEIIKKSSYGPMLIQFVSVFIELNNTKQQRKFNITPYGKNVY